MVWVWVLDAVDIFLGWFSSWWPDWTIPWPDPVTILVPVPLGLAIGDGLETWVFWGLAVAGVLLVGRVLYWLYRIIPMNG